jgi:hypothetical protein
MSSIAVDEEADRVAGYESRILRWQVFERMPMRKGLMLRAEAKSYTRRAMNDRILARLCRIDWALGAER